ncbi:hypothetical protein GCM10009122_54520 [Fulvivirga kasyanovii]
MDVTEAPKVKEDSMRNLLKQLMAVIVLTVSLAACEDHDVKPVNADAPKIDVLNGQADDTTGGGEDEEDPIIQEVTNP